MYKTDKMDAYFKSLWEAVLPSLTSEYQIISKFETISQNTLNDYIIHKLNLLQTYSLEYKKFIRHSPGKSYQGVFCFVTHVLASSIKYVVVVVVVVVVFVFYFSCFLYFFRSNVLMFKC